MNAQDYIRLQRKRRNRTIGLAVAAMLALLAIVIFLFWMNREPASASIPEPGTATPPPDQYPEVEAHAVTMAGYDLSDEDWPFILLSDPADNIIAGKSHDFDPAPLRLPLVTDGRCWFVDYPGEAIGCIYGALIVRESSHNEENLTARWENADLPDLSQNAIEEWGSHYCAPTAAANIVWMMGKKYPQMAPAQVFGLPQNTPMELQANMLIAGMEKPFPNPGSLAGLMKSKQDDGTAFLNLGAGMKAFLGNGMGEWHLNGPDYLEPNSLFETLKEESAHGSGVILLLHWGNPKMDEEDNGGAMLMVLERNVEQPDSTEQQQTESGKPVTIEEMGEGGGELELAEVIAGGGEEPGGGANDFGLIKEDIMERLKDVKAGSGDIQLSLAWNNYNDLDLSCTEPDGTVIDFEHRRSPSGGNLDVDMNATPQSKRPVENIFWPLGQARRGKYQVHANYYRRHTSSREKIEFTLRVVLGKKEQFFKGKLPPKSGRVVIHTFEYK